MKSVSMAIIAIAAFAAVSVHAQRGGPETAGINFRMPIESKIIKGLPYSAEIRSESVQTLADGNRIVQKTTGRVYRDNEGRTRREEDRPSGGSSVTISDVVSRRSYSLNAATHVAIEGPMPIGPFLASAVLSGSGELATFVLRQEDELKAELSKVQQALEQQGAGRGGRGASAADAAAQKQEERTLVEAKKLEAARNVTASNPREEATEERLQDRLIGGILAAGTRRTTIIAAGAIGNEQPIKVVSEEWYSPDLQILVQTERTDPRLGRSIYQVTNINRNEPDSTLFQVPPDYTIRAGRK